LTVTSVQLTALAVVEASVGVAVGVGVEVGVGLVLPHPIQQKLMRRARLRNFNIKILSLRQKLKHKNVF
jgi:hypothetical protein